MQLINTEDITVISSVLFFAEQPFSMLPKTKIIPINFMVT